MLTTILYTILGIIIGFFALHFISLFLVKWYKKKTGIYEVFGFKHLSLCLSGYPNIMVTFHYYSRYMVEEEGYYANSIVIEYGGYTLTFRYGHQGYDEPEDFDMSHSYYYGLYSIDGEWLWHDIWWGKNKAIRNPFMPNYFCGAYMYDIKKDKFISKNFLPDEQIPYCLIMNNTEYVTKDSEIQKVNCIKWYICERSWTLPILHWLHLDDLYKRHHVDLEFESDTELGVKAGSWKGGVIGSSISLHKEPELYKLYKQTQRNPGMVLLLEQALNKRIRQFMTQDKKY